MKEKRNRGREIRKSGIRRGRNELGKEHKEKENITLAEERKGEKIKEREENKRKKVFQNPCCLARFSTFNVKSENDKKNNVGNGAKGKLSHNGG
jgi:hypothetical protein